MPLPPIMPPAMPPLCQAPGMPMCAPMPFPPLPMMLPYPPAQNTPVAPPVAMSTSRPVQIGNLGTILSDPLPAKKVQVALEVKVLALSDDVLERLGGNLPQPVRQAVWDSTAGCERIGVDFNSPPRVMVPVQFLNGLQTDALFAAVQGDQRCSVVASPKLVLLDNQAGTIDMKELTPLLTGLNSRWEGDHFIMEPVVQQTPLGFRLMATPSVSADRRFVRLHMNAEHSCLNSTCNAVMPTAAPMPCDSTPRLSTQRCDTTVQVPDGGTVVIGGFKKLVETRTEFGPPVLSDVPYVNRFFKQVGYGREAQQLVLVVTPRIIIEQEVEEKAAPKCCDRARPSWGEECEPPCKCEPMSRQAKVLAELLKAYDEACADGKADEAEKFAKAALAIDPTCFRRKH
jgi:type II secretory pathway component GspD/PulD (secretin)